MQPTAATRNSKPETRNPPDPLARTLARFAANLTYEDLPPAVVDKAKACILHCLAVGLAAHTSSAAAAARAAVLATEALPPHPSSLVPHTSYLPPHASLLIDGAGATPYGAAFVNSALMHAKLQEDAYHTGSHPGVMIIPAALAVAEAEHKTGRDLITAVVAGYEVEAAITADFIPNSNNRGFRSSPIYGPFGAAVAAGRLLALDEDRMTHAIGYAATFAGGTFEGGDGTHIMVLQVAQAPRNGVFAAYLARHGARASDTSLDGPIGFYYAFTGANQGLEHLGDHLIGAPAGSNTPPVTPNIPPVILSTPPVILSPSAPLRMNSAKNLEGGRGGGPTHWEIMDVTLKRYPTSMFNQPPLHLALELTKQHDLDPEDIASIDVEMNDFETTYPGAKFRAAGGSFVQRTGNGSTAFVVAAACVNRGFAVPPDRPSGWSSPIEGIDRLPTHQQSLELQKRVTITGSPDTRPLSPRVTIRLESGRTHQAQATGDEFKLTFAQDQEIVRALAQEMPGGEQQAASLIAAIEALDQAPDIQGILQAATT